MAFSVLAIFGFESIHQVLKIKVINVKIGKFGDKKYKNVPLSTLNKADHRTR